MPPLDVDDFVFDDDNEAKFATHRITVEEVQQILDGYPRFYENRRRRRASHVMMGRTFDGRLLVVPIERVEPGLWRPITAFDPTPTQAATYRSRP